MSAGLERRLAAEFVGTALLLAAVVGSGVMGARLAGGNMALALLANTLATGAMLLVLVLAFGALSAQFNPVVTLCEAWTRALPWREVPAYVAAQLAGAFAGVAAAHAMFALPLFDASRQARSGAAQAFSELVATFGLVLVLRLVARARREAVPFAVAAYITSAYWFTASTSFANPAVTLARSATDTFSGIRPADAPAFVLAQLVGGAGALLFGSWLVREPAPVRARRRGASKPSTAMHTVLFACIHNAGRSQMASAFFAARCDPARARSISAGTRPAAAVHPLVVEAMREVGIELAHVTPRRLTSELAAEADVLVTLGCGEECPIVPGVRRLDWPLEDPAARSIEDVRRIRDEIAVRVDELLEGNGWRARGR